jgi:hypothetical protein
MGRDSVAAEEAGRRQVEGVWIGTTGAAHGRDQEEGYPAIEFALEGQRWSAIRN